MVALPRLRPDVHVEARSDVHGPYYRLNSADGTRSHRLSQPAYMALSMLDGRFGWEQWSAAVQTAYPQVTEAHMTDLLREVSAMGFLDGKLVLGIEDPPSAEAAFGPPGDVAVPLEVTGVREAFELPAEDVKELPAEMAANAEMDIDAFDALFSPTDQGTPFTPGSLQPEPTQISAPPSEMEDPYLRELGGALPGPKLGPDVGVVELEEPPPPTAEISMDLVSDLSSEPPFLVEEPPPPPNLSLSDVAAASSEPPFEEIEGMDVQFTDLAVKPLARGSSGLDDLPVAQAMESMEGAPAAESLDPFNQGEGLPLVDIDIEEDPFDQAERGVPSVDIDIEDDPFNQPLNQPYTQEPTAILPTPDGGATDPFAKDWGPGGDPSSAEATFGPGPPIDPSSENSGVTTMILNSPPIGDDASMLSTLFEQDLLSSSDEEPETKPALVRQPPPPPEMSIPEPAAPGPQPGEASNDFFDFQQGHGPDDDLPLVTGASPDTPGAFGPIDMPSQDAPSPSEPSQASSAPSSQDVPSRGKAKAFGGIKAKASPEPGLLLVTAPSGKTFQIYELEHQLLGLLDGERDLPELREAFAKAGQPVDEAQLASFIRQMNAYGFLQSTGPIVAASSAPTAVPWKEGPPVESDSPPEEWPAEERRLFQQGLQHFRDGSYEKAEGFFSALLEVNPKNPEASSMIELMHTERPTDGKKKKKGKKEKKGEKEKKGSDDREDKGSNGGRIFLLTLILLATITAGAGMAFERPVTTTVPLILSEAPPALIESSIAGVVTALPVALGPVQAKAVVVQLAAADLEPAQARAATELAAAKRDIEVLSGTPEEAKALTAAARTAKKTRRGLEKTLAKLQRKTKRGSRSSRARNKAKVEELAPKVEAAKALETEAKRVASLASKTDDDTTIGAANARLAAANAAVEKIEAEVKRRAVVAPTSGTLTKLNVVVGAEISAKTPVFEMKKKGRYTTELLLEESALTLVEVGGRIDMRMVAFPDATYRGTVTNIGQEVETVDERRIVRVAATVVDDSGRLKPKMSGTAAVQGEPQPITILVWQRVVAWARLQFLI